MTDLTEEDLEKLKSRIKEVFSDYRELAGGYEYRYHHLISVNKYVREIVKAENLEKEIDMRILEAASLLHDIGRSKDIDENYLNPIAEHEGHDEKGAELIERYADDILNTEELETVKKIVRNHHSEPETVEGKVLQDADLLFKFGVQNIWRTFHYAYKDDRTLKESVEYFQDKEKHRMDEKIDDFHFESSKSTAETRLQKLEDTYTEIVTELHGRDINH